MKKRDQHQQLKLRQNKLNRVHVTMVVATIQVLVSVLFVDFVIRHILWLFLLTYLCSFYLVLQIIRRDMAAAYQIGWILLILLLPIAGTVAYLLMETPGVSEKVRIKLNEQRKKSCYVLAKYMGNKAAHVDGLSRDPRLNTLFTYLHHHTGFIGYTDTQAKYFSLGQHMYYNMLVDMAHAETYIFVQYFLVSDGAMWRGIEAVLVEKAAMGVDVRVMVDDFASAPLFNQRYMSELRAKGIKVATFSKMRPFFSKFENTRDHRKILVVDGNVGYNGGINLADAYVNLGNEDKLWKDVGVRLQGSAVISFMLMFVETWNTFCLKQEKITDHAHYMTTSPCCEQVSELLQPAQIQQTKDIHHMRAAMKHQLYKGQETPNPLGAVFPFSDNPLNSQRISENVYIEILNQAREYVYIYTPFLIFSEHMRYALQMAKKRGVDVRLILPGIHDWTATGHRLVQNMNRSYYTHLQKVGIKVYEYPNTFVHAKCFVSDDKLAVVGTINLDYRSLYLHFECGVIYYKNQVVSDVKTDWLDAMAQSMEVFGDNLTAPARAVNLLLTPLVQLM